MKTGRKALDGIIWITNTVLHSTGEGKAKSIVFNAFREEKGRGEKVVNELYIYVIVFEIVLY